MKVKFWGVRGSLPAPGPTTVEYGGNTSCVEVRSISDNVYVVDAGTGLRELGNQLLKEGKKDIAMFITHTHWDHIQGFPFFVPAYIPGHKITAYSGNRTLANEFVSQNKKADTRRMVRSLEDALASNKDGQEDDLKTDFAKQMDLEGTKRHFPVKLSEMGANIYFKTLQPGEVLDTRDLVVKHTLQNHPGGACGYKFLENSKTASFIFDMELKGYRAGRMAEENQYLVEFVKGSDLLVVDAQYTSQEYLGGNGAPSKEGWGHSTLDGVLELARLASIENVVGFHHDPSHTDQQLAELERSTQEQANKLSIKFSLAKEGAEIDVV